jgi:ABC-type cobalamin/Fe3+-siderophores transport system ATPase subunit
VLPAPARTLRIGRAEDNDVVVDDLSVSRHHAELWNSGDGFEIVDLGSRNGTFLNGSPVLRALVTEQDLVGIGPATFRLVGDELEEFLDQGDVSLVARDLTVRDGGRVRLDRVSFPIGEPSLVAVIGPSGAGKSTLLHALTGLRPATEGAVRYNNRDLYAEYAELRHRIGLVPQDDVIYPRLTPRRFLGYAAELRFPGDTTIEERSRRVQEVIDELKLMQTTKDQPDPPADRPSGNLSGGQKKRVNIALELLTKPSVLFLDEPTSSLDVELKEDVGVLIRLCAGGPGLRGPANSRAEITLLMLVIMAAVIGVFSSVRELIKERDMYRRERMAGLSAGTYLLSKVAVLGFVVVIQAALLVLVGLAGARMPSHGAVLAVPLAELIVDVAVFSVTSMTLGLLVSALAGSQELALLAGILLAIGQVMLTGAVLPLTSWLKVLSIFVPARWGFAAVASTSDLNAIQPPGSIRDPFWAHTPAAWLRAVGAQLVLTAVFALVAWWRLIQISPGRTRRPRLGRVGR